MSPTRPSFALGLAWLLLAACDGSTPSGADGADSAGSDAAPCLPSAGADGSGADVPACPPECGPCELCGPATGFHCASTRTPEQVCDLATNTCTCPRCEPCVDCAGDGTCAPRACAPGFACDPAIDSCVPVECTCTPACDGCDACVADPAIPSRCRCESTCDP